MAKVENPLFSQFLEAFRDVIVFQRNGSATPIARVKVRHPENWRSAHFPPRLPGWDKAVQAHAAAGNPAADMVPFIARYALSPTRPSWVTTIYCTEHETFPDLVNFKIAWQPPSTKYRGHVLANLLGYFVEMSQDNYHWTRLNSEPVTIAELTGEAPAGDVWVMVLATDDENNVSTPSVVVKLGDSLTNQKYDVPPFDLAFYADEEP